MHRIGVIALSLPLLLVSCTTSSTPTVTSAPQQKSGVAADSGKKLDRQFTTNSRPIASKMTLSSFFRPARGEWRPSVAGARGDFALFSRVVPSVVVVRTATGHGTGFLVDPSGLIVTNHHVISDGLSHDLQMQASHAVAHTGTVMPDGRVELDAAPIRAFLLKADPERDLALLRLETVPQQMKPIELSSAPPRPGDDLNMLGHPSSGMLWMFRPGKVASIGQYPTDMMDFVMTRLFSEDAGAAVPAYKGHPTKVVISSAGANPGDSGGPVVDELGRLVGVTFAGPGDVRDDKFTYHVHVDEVRSFLASVPSKPMLQLPDPWAFGATAELSDLDGDGTPDMLMAGTDRPEAILFDLDNDTDPALLTEGRLADLVGNRSWDYEVALTQSGAEMVVHYDTDNDGVIDMMMWGADLTAPATAVLVLSNGRWQERAPDEEPVVSASRLAGPNGSRWQQIWDLW